MSAEVADLRPSWEDDEDRGEQETPTNLEAGAVCGSSNPPAAPVLGDGAAHAFVSAVVDLARSWLRWGEMGRGGRRIQACVKHVREWGRSGGRVQKVLAAERTKRLLMLGDKVLSWADVKLGGLQRTKIGRPVCILVGEAAKRVEPLVRPRAAGDRGLASSRMPIHEHCTPPRTRGALALRCSPGHPRVSPSGAPGGGPVIHPEQVQGETGTHGPQGASSTRTGGEEFAKESAALLKALSAPLDGAKHLFFDSIPGLVHQPSANQDSDVAEMEFSDEELLDAAGLPTRRSQVANEADLLAAAGLPSSRSQAADEAQQLLAAAGLPGTGRLRSRMGAADGRAEACSGAAAARAGSAVSSAVSSGLSSLGSGLSLRQFEEDGADERPAGGNVGEAMGIHAGGA